MRKRLGFFATAAAALSAMLGMAPQQHQLPTTQNQSSEQRSNDNQQQKRIQEIPRSTQTVVQSAGGFDVIRVRGNGMSPKWYGENMVRKGTHKRTNKRK